MPTKTNKTADPIEAASDSVPAARRRRRTKVEEPAHPLSALIPSQERLDCYASRYIGGVLDLDVMDAAFDQAHNVAVFGPTGSAKTSLVMAYGRRKMLPVVTVPCNGAADPTFLFGGWRPNPDGTFSLRPGVVYYAAKYGGLIYLDEFNFLPPKMAALFHAPMDSRRIMAIPDFDGCDSLDAMGNPIESLFRVHDSCMFVAAWNPDYAGTYQINEATFNRFCHKIPFDYDPAVEENLLNSTTLIKMATALRDGVRSGTFTTSVTTNALIELEDNANHEALGIAYAFENFVNAFRPEEREAVRQVIHQYQDKIAKELDIVIADEVIDDEESMDWDDYYNEDDDQ